MMISGVRSRPRQMHTHVHGAPVFVRQLLGKAACKLNTSLGGQLSREDCQPFTRKARITTQSSVLRGIPQRGAIPRPSHAGIVCQVRGQDDFLMRHITTVRVIVNLTRPLVPNPLPRAIGGRSRHPRSISPRDMFGAEKINRHRASPSNVTPVVVSSLLKQSLASRPSRVALIPQCRSQLAINGCRVAALR